MTNNEALERIDKVLSSDYHYDETLGYQLTSDDFEWLEAAKQALEKQIPKKPKLLGSMGYCECPCCKHIITMHEQAHGDIKIPCCKWCGQALDWSEDDV